LKPALRARGIRLPFVAFADRGAGRRRRSARRALLQVLAAVAIATLAHGAVAAPGDPSGVPIDRYPGAAAAYAVVIDGRLAWGRAIDAPRPPASLAKLLTAIVLLDRGWDPQEQIPVSATAAGMPAARLGLRAGDSLRAGDALAALLVRSANDACAALAEHAAGSLGAFAARMNERAAALGMRASHFVNPCGLDAPGQQSTARDLLRLAQAASEHPVIATAVAQRSASLATSSGQQLRFDNGNLLLGRVDGVVGMKSGFTSNAGRCLIALARRGTHQVWLVLLDAPDRWRVATGILFDAFDHAVEASPAAR